MDARTQDAVARAMQAAIDALEAQGYVRRRTVYVGNRLEKCYQPSAHEYVVFLQREGCDWLPDRGVVKPDGRVLRLVGDGDAA